MISPRGGNIRTLAIPKYWLISLKSDVITSGCPTGYLQVLLTQGYKEVKSTYSIFSSSFVL